MNELHLNAYVNYSYNGVHEYCYVHVQCIQFLKLSQLVYGIIIHVDRPLPGAIVSFRLKAKWRLIGRRTRGVVSGRGKRLLGLGGGGRRRYVLEHDLSGETSRGGIT